MTDETTNEPTNDQLADDMKDIVERLASDEHDDPTGRLDVGCGLINLMNYAIQHQAGRNMWDISDYRAFVNALHALDSIKPKGVQDKTIAPKTYPQRRG